MTRARVIAVLWALKSSLDTCGVREVGVLQREGGSETTLAWESGMGNNLGIRQEIAGELMGTSGYERYFLEIINLINLERLGLV